MIAITPEECEFYTPDTILERVYKVFDIDLDPCSPVDCKPVKAKNYFTKNDDGLSQLWFGNVFCNPPYGSQLKVWINKLTSEYTRGGGGKYDCTLS